MKKETMKKIMNTIILVVIGMVAGVLLTVVIPTLRGVSELHPVFNDSATDCVRAMYRYSYEHEDGRLDKFQGENGEIVKVWNCERSTGCLKVNDEDVVSVGIVYEFNDGHKDTHIMY